MSEPTVLVFAYYYRPENAIGAERPYRFTKYLRRLGYRVRVFSASDPVDRPEPETDYLPDPFRSGAKDLGWQLERALRYFVLPGAGGVRWAFRAAAAAKAYIRENKPGPFTLFSTSPQMGPHIAALQVSRSERVPWIADYRDPLTGFFLDEVAGETTSQYRKRRYEMAYSALEKHLVKKADLSIANTVQSQERLHRLFPDSAGKIRMIWNGFDPEERSAWPSPPARTGPLTLVHAGSLYHGRTAVPLLASLHRLISTGRLSSEKVKIRLIGAADPECLPDPAFCSRASGEGWLDLVAHHVSRPIADEATRNAGALLLIQPHTKLQVPAKLYSYILGGRPVLAFVPRNSSVEEILRLSGVPYRCVYSDMTDAEFDDAMFGFFDNPPGPAGPSAAFLQQFSAETQAHLLDGMIRGLGSGRPAVEPADLTFSR